MLCSFLDDTHAGNAAAAVARFASNILQNFVSDMESKEHLPEILGSSIVLVLLTYHSVEMLPVQ